MMKKLLLISNSTGYGSGYLDHCEPEIRDFLGDAIKKIAFVPYALPDRDAYSVKASERFADMGYELSSIHFSDDPAGIINGSDAIFIGGGNTFLLLKTLYDEGLVDVIRRKVEGGAPYVGTSAGSNVACISIKTTNDMPIVHPPSFDALGLVPFNINPHFMDPDPNSKHKGETRKERIDQFHKLNDPAVMGLRESAMLLVEDNRMTLRGPTGAKLFRKGTEPEEYSPGADLSFLLK